MKTRFFSLLVAGAFLALAAPVQAQMACTAALDNDVHYCNDDQDVCGPGCAPTCDPLNIMPPDIVTVTVEITNESEFQGGMLMSPPEGVLLAGSQIKVYYACSSSTCFAGQELPLWLNFVSVEYSHPDVTFVDDGNGYSGTLTIDNDITYNRSFTDAVKLVRVQTTVGTFPPVIEGSQIFARSGQPGAPAFDDSSNVFLVTDTECLSGLLGGGQGSTAGMIFNPMGNDLSICSHANKQLIKIDNSGPLDFTNMKFSFPFDNYDPEACDLTVGLDNSLGGLFNFQTLPMGALVPTGKCWTYSNKSAKNQVGGGVQRAQICPLNTPPNSPQRWCLTFKGWGDFDGILLDPSMPIAVNTCAENFEGPDPALWIPGPTKWTLPKSAFAPNP